MYFSPLGNKLPAYPDVFHQDKTRQSKMLENSGEAKSIGKENLQCPDLATGGHHERTGGCRHYPQKRTLMSRIRMAVFDPSRTIDS
jgi:hypothetical protein